ncbi:hypothetical protein AAEH92_18000 [Shewanella xiamenensis]|uniref:hypothetical protein n=1 Tax=Shewanella xiamenensis TaxID=332186 RepID=UPI00313E216B
MNTRQIVTLMHKLHYGDVDTSDGYEHLMVDGKFEFSKFERFVCRYIKDPNMVFYANSQLAGFGDIQNAFEFTRTNMADNRIRIASIDFRAKIIIEPLGVGIGHLTSQSTQTPTSGAGV